MLVYFDIIEIEAMLKALKQIKVLEAKTSAKGTWGWKSDEEDTDTATLKELKKELGLPENEAVS